MSCPPRVIVDAGNLRSGGGLQVASALVQEMQNLATEAWAVRRWPFLPSIDYVLSPEVACNLNANSLASGTTITSRRPRDLIGAEPTRYDISLVVFGPEYARGRARRRIVGCADGLVLLPEARLLSGTGVGRRLKSQLKRALWRRQLRSVDSVVESRALRRAVIALGAPRERVHLVPNCPHPVFLDVAACPRPGLSRRPGELLFCYPARAHPHKNHSFLLRLHDELRLRHGRVVRFVVTLTEQELVSFQASWERALINVGPLVVEELPGLYAACDGVIFPSLLESFSVTPLEALAAARPLFASDCNFVRDVVGDCAGYFDARDCRQAADAFVSWWDDADRRACQVVCGRRLVGDLPDARDRAIAYLEIVERIAREDAQ